jgi:hypothetical protein
MMTFTTNVNHACCLRVSDKYVIANTCININRLSLCDAAAAWRLHIHYCPGACQWCLLQAAKHATCDNHDILPADSQLSKGSTTFSRNKHTLTTALMISHQTPTLFTRDLKATRLKSIVRLLNKSNPSAAATPRLSLSPAASCTRSSTQPRSARPSSWLSWQAHPAAVTAAAVLQCCY